MQHNSLPGQPSLPEAPWETRPNWEVEKTTMELPDWLFRVPSAAQSSVAQRKLLELPKSMVRSWELELVVLTRAWYNNPADKLANKLAMANGESGLLPALNFLQKTAAKQPSLVLPAAERFQYCQYAWRREISPVLQPLLDDPEVDASLRRTLQILSVSPEIARQLTMARALQAADADPEAKLADWLQFLHWEVADAIRTLPERVTLTTEEGEFLQAPRSVEDKLMRQELIEVWRALMSAPDLAELLIRKPQLLREMIMTADADQQLLQQVFPEQEAAIQDQVTAWAPLRQDRSFFLFLLQHKGLVLDLSAPAEAVENEAARQQLAERFAWAKDEGSWQAAWLERLQQPAVVELMAQLADHFVPVAPHYGHQGVDKLELLRASWGQAPDGDLMRAVWLERYGEPPTNWQERVQQSLLHDDGSFTGLSDPALLAVPEHQAAIAALLKLPYGLQAANKLLQVTSKYFLEQQEVLPGYHARSQQVAQECRRQQGFQLMMLSARALAQGRSFKCSEVLDTYLSAKDNIPTVIQKNWGMLHALLAKPKVALLADDEPCFFNPIFEQLPLAARSASLKEQAAAESDREAIEAGLPIWLDCPMILAALAQLQKISDADWPRCLAGLTVALGKFAAAEKECARQQDRREDPIDKMFQREAPRWYRERILGVLSRCTSTLKNTLARPFRPVDKGKAV